MRAGRIGADAGPGFGQCLPQRPQYLDGSALFTVLGADAYEHDVEVRWEAGGSTRVDGPHDRQHAPGTVTAGP